MPADNRYPKKRASRENRAQAFVLRMFKMQSMRAVRRDKKPTQNQWQPDGRAKLRASSETEYRRAKNAALANTKRPTQRHAIYAKAYRLFLGRLLACILIARAFPKQISGFWWATSNLTAARPRSIFTNFRFLKNARSICNPAGDVKTIKPCAAANARYYLQASAS